jgi:purine-binding chemotaxis protein CheW
MSPESTRSTDRAGQLVSFRVGKEYYGIDILRIREVINHRNITRIPNAPRFVEGVLELRGQVIPIIDLKKRLDLDQGGRQTRSRIVVLDLSEPLGIIVDDISRILRLPGGNYEAVPDTLVCAGATGAIESLARTDDGHLILVLDPGRLLTVTEQAALASMQRMASEDRGRAAG